MDLTQKLSNAFSVVNHVHTSHDLPSLVCWSWTRGTDMSTYFECIPCHFPSRLDTCGRTGNATSNVVNLLTNGKLYFYCVRSVIPPVPCFCLPVLSLGLFLLLLPRFRNFSQEAVTKGPGVEFGRKLIGRRALGGNDGSTWQGGRLLG